MVPSEAVRKARAIRQKLLIFELSLQPSQAEGYSVRIFRTHVSLYPTGDILGKHRVSRDQQERLNGIVVLSVTSETKFQLQPR